MKTAKPTRVRVTRQDMRTGEAGNCFRCAVASALQRATGDDHANVYEDDWVLYLEAHCRSITAPWSVVAFSRAYDDLPRRGDGTPVLPRKLPDDLKPFVFDLPPFDDPEWEERCYGCEELFSPSELDGEGNCPGCHREAGEP